MNEKVTIDGEELESVPLHRAAVELLVDHGALPNNGRSEWIDGVFVPMTPSHAAHAAAVIDIGHALRSALGRSRQVLADPAFFLSDDTMLAPDILVLAPNVALPEAAGADADLLIEIAHTTLAVDLRLKAQRYGRAGIADYWVVDLENRRLHVHRGPMQDGYAEVTAHPWETPVTALRLPEVTLTMASVLD